MISFNLLQHQVPELQAEYSKVCIRWCHLARNFEVAKLEMTGINPLAGQVFWWILINTIWYYNWIRVTKPCWVWHQKNGMRTRSYFSIHLEVEYFFPTCQVRVVRFYVCSPPSSPPPPPSSPPSFSPSSSQTSTWSSRSQCAAPDLTERRTSPRSSRADRAAPDLTRGAPERTVQRRTSAARRYVKRYVRKECQKKCQKICQGICQKRTPERMSERMSEDMSEEMSEMCQKRMSEDMSEEISEDMSIEISDSMSEKNVRKNVRRYVRRNVRRYVIRYVR